MSLFVCVLNLTPVPVIPEYNELLLNAKEYPGILQGSPSQIKTWT